MDRARYIARNLLVALAVSLLLLVFVVAGTWAFLATEGGRDWAAAAARAAAASAGVDLRITGLQGGLPARIAADRVVVADRQGPWLEIEDPVVEWRPLALLGGVLDLQRVGAARIRVARLPAGADASAGERTVRVSVPAPAVDLRLGRLALPEVRLEAPVLGQTAVLAVTGSGADPGWAGRVSGSIGEATAELALRLDTGAEPVARLSGRADLAAVLPARLRPLFAGGLALAGTVALADESIVLRSLSLGTDAVGLAATGRVAPDGGLGLSVELERVDERALGAALDPWALEAVSGRLEVTGTVVEPRLAALLDIQGFAAPGFEGAGLALELRVARGPDGAGIALELEAGARALDWALTGADPLVRGPAELSAAGRVTASGRLELDRLEAVLPDATLAGTLALDPAARTLVLPARVEIRDLAALRGLTRLDLHGSAGLDATLSLPAFDGRIRVEARGRLRDFDPGIPVVERFAAGDLALNARLDLGPSSGLAISGIELSGQNLDATGSVRIPAGYERLEVTAEARLPRASILTPALGVALDGSAQASARLQGPIGNPVLEGRVAVDRAVVAGEPLQSVVATVTLSDLAALINGRVGLEADSAYGPASLATGIGIGDGRVVLEDARLAVGPARATGRVSVPYTGPPLSASLSFASETVAPMLARFGLEGGGAATGSLTLEPAGPRQSAVLDLALTSLRLGGAAPEAWTVERVVAGARASGLFDAGERPGEAGLEGSVTLEGLDGPGLRLEVAQADFSGIADGLATTGSASGELYGAPLALDTELSLTRPGEATLLRLRSLTGRMLGLQVNSREEARLGFEGRRVSLEGLDLALGEGRLQADALVGAADGHLRAAGQGLPVALLGLASPALALAGTVGFELALAQPGQGPATGRLDLALRDLKLPDRVRAVGIEASLEARFTDRGLDISATASGPVANPVAASGRVPLTVDLAQPAFLLDRDAALAASVQWQGRAGRVLVLLPMGEHLLDGDLDASLRVGGSLAEPEVTGRLTLEDGRYEHLTAGTLLRPLALTIEGHGDELRLTRFEARDGDDGRVTATGRLLLDPARAYPLDAEVVFAHAMLVRRDEVTARVSGDLGLGREGGRTRLSGRIETEEVEARLVGRLPPEVVVLDVVEAGEAGDRNADGAARPGDQGLLALDVGVRVPRRFFLRGRGLDSEWRGNLAVGGTAAAPVIEGSLRSVRGVMVILGKRFELAPSTVSFRGGREVNPELDIVATYDGPDLTVTARLTGTLARPQIGLESVPTLPEDEILARTLFGKSATELSALEAVQLAAAVGELYGVSGGGGLLERARSAVGVDVLRVGTAEEEGGATLEAGKYVSEGVYLGVEQGSAAQSGAVSVEVELTPRILLRSDFREDGRSNVGIEFKRDY